MMHLGQRLLIEGHKALQSMRGVVQKRSEQLRIEGLKTNLPFFARLLDDPMFTSGDYDTGLIEKMNK